MADPTEEQLRALLLENEKLRSQISTLHKKLGIHETLSQGEEQEEQLQRTEKEGHLPLSLDEYKRYGRQMIVPSIGLPGQLRLKSASVLIVGAGGLGCPAGAYLAGAGIGTLGVCDGDTVESSNLHRQITHTTSRIGMKKVDSMVQSLRDSNPHVNYRAHPYHLTPQNAIETIEKYHMVLDCTDHPAVRYLISDVCVLLGKPFVSASALRTEGQLLVLNYPPGISACYRCIWPKPPPPESVLSCAEGGILGPVVGAMGVLVSIETIKLITADPESIPKEVKETNMLIYSAYSNPNFRNLRLRGKRRGCKGCDPERQEISLDRFVLGEVDYDAFCGTRKEERVGEDEKVDVKHYAAIRAQRREHLLIDVREEVEWGMCRLDGSINVPILEFLDSLPSSDSMVDEDVGPPSWLPQDKQPPIFIVCKHGNDSQVAVKRLKAYLRERQVEAFGEAEAPGALWEGGIWDIKGGFREWRKEVDYTFPEY